MNMKVPTNGSEMLCATFVAVQFLLLLEFFAAGAHPLTSSSFLLKSSDKAQTGNLLKGAVLHKGSATQPIELNLSMHPFT
jgi:hypothetical protein